MNNNRRELTVDPFWTTELDSEPKSLNYHESGNILVATVSEDKPTGPAITIIDTRTGTILGTIQTDGKNKRSEFIESEELLLISTKKDYVYAIDPRSVTIRWETRARQIGYVTDETVYLYSDATMWAYDLSSGAERWEHVLPGTILNMQMVNGTLIIEVGEYGEEGGIVAIDPSAGDENWYYRPGDAGAFKVTDHGIYVTIFDSAELANDVARIDERTGTEKWSFTCTSSPKIYGFQIGEQSVFVQERRNGTVAAIDQVTGTLNWRSEEYSRCNGIWLGDSALFVDGSGSSSEDFEHKFHAVDFQSGRTKWEVEVEQQVRCCDSESRPEEIYIGTNGDDEGTVYAVTRRTGSLLWHCTLGEKVEMIYPRVDPVIAAGGDTVYALDGTDGQPLWSFTGVNPFARSLITEERVVFINTSFEGYLINRDDGSLEGKFDWKNVVTGGGALFITDDRDLKAYPVAETPEAFQQETDQESSTPTEVFTGESDSNAETETPDGTQVFESATDSDETAADEDAPTIAFCPSCGTDLSEFGDVSFCPSCGAELSMSGE